MINTNTNTTTTTDLGKEGLFLKDCEDAEGLLEHGDAGLEVHPNTNTNTNTTMYN